MARAALRHPVVAVRRRQVLPLWVRRWDAAAAARLNASPSHRHLDRTLVALSTAANHGVLWFALAGVLLVAGRGRAALRGVASLTVASATANLIGKQLFGGDRPLLKDVPLPRQLARTPTSPSFPSGHSASAAAFVTGIALESPGWGAGIAPLAGGVAYSRAFTGAHWPSDVVGGVAIGVATALAGKVLVPARPGPDARSEDRPVEGGLPATADGDGLFLLVNPAAGSASLPGISRRLPRARIHLLTEREDATLVIRKAFRRLRRPRLLGVCGGDGTVATAAAEAVRLGVPLLVLPGGTFNHFARAAGVASIDDALRALAEGTGRRVDVAEWRRSGHEPALVLNTASVGVYPEFVRKRDDLRLHWGKPLASLAAAVSVLGPSEPLRLTIDGRSVEAWSVFIGVDRYTPADAAPLQRTGTADGVLDVRILRAGSPSKTRGALALTLGTAANAVFRRIPLPRPGDVVDSFTATEVSFSARTRSGRPVPSAHDGEIEPADVDWGIRLVGAALTVYVPRS